MGFAPPTMGLSFPSFPEYAQIIAGTFRMRAPELMSRTIVLEPGISMVGDAFTFYAAVTAVKVVAGRTLVFVDGSVHNVKPTRHRHELPVCALDAFSMEPKTGATRACDVVGYTCMEDDFLAVDSQLPEVEVGDILRFDNVGAYTTVLKPPFIRGAPKVYVVEGGTFKEARRAENMEVFLGGYVT